jgi:hypothetical protein
MMRIKSELVCTSAILDANSSRCLAHELWCREVLGTIFFFHDLNCSAKKALCFVAVEECTSAILGVKSSWCISLTNYGAQKFWAT